MWETEKMVTFISMRSLKMTIKYPISKLKMSKFDFDVDRWNI